MFFFSNCNKDSIILNNKIWTNIYRKILKMILMVWAFYILYPHPLPELHYYKIS